MEEDNKYWLGKEKRLCVFCVKEKDNWGRYIKKGEITKKWLENLRGREREGYGIKN